MLIKKQKIVHSYFLFSLLLIIAVSISLKILEDNVLYFSLTNRNTTEAKHRL